MGVNLTRSSSSAIELTSRPSQVVNPVVAIDEGSCDSGDGVITLGDLYLRSPYLNFNPAAHKAVLSGWAFDTPTFKKVIEETVPKLIIEVGVWKGCSTIHMAETSAKVGLRPTIVCIDTWLGSLEFWTDKKDGRNVELGIVNGYPTVFYKFLANVCSHGLQDQVIPFPQTSSIAARWLTRKQVQADLVYVDASHDYEDVLADLVSYYPLVRPGGILFGDDFGDAWPGVPKAVTEFSVGKNLTVEEDFKWVIRR